MANSASELALVGPDMTCQLDPNSAATMHGTMAVYRPYCGGRPASAAKAMPWGSTSTAPSRPASRSARSVRPDTKATQSPKMRCATRRQGADAAAERGEDIGGLVKTAGRNRPDG